MSQYRVLRAFRAVYGEREYSGLPGQVVEIAPEVAEWIERDAPGRIRPETEDRGPETGERVVEAPTADRMQRRKRIR